MQAPKTYSPQEMAGAQGAATREAAQTGAIVNNTNQRSPFGNVDYSIAGYETIKDASGKDVQVPRYTQTTTLSPGQQGLLDTQTQVGQAGLNLANEQIGRLGNTLNTPFNTSGLPAADAPTLNTSMQPMSAAQPDVQVGQANTGMMGMGAAAQSDASRQAMTAANMGMTPMGAAAQSDASRQAMGAAPTSYQQSAVDASRQAMGGAPTSVNQGQVNAGPSGAQTTNADFSAGMVNADRFGRDRARGQVGPSDFSQDRLNVENALLSRTEPQFARDEDRMRTRLANQGLMPGAEASNADLDTLNRARNDARMQAVLAGGQEQSRQFQNQLAQGQFANQAVGQNNQAALASHALQYQGIGQNNAARQAMGQFDLQRNAQNNATRLAEAQNQRAAVGQNNAANMAQGQFTQQGVAQNNAAGLAAYNAQLAAIGQNNAANQAQGQFGQQGVAQNNAANLQSYNAYLAAMGQNNAAVGQNNQANLAAQGLQNQAVAQNNAANMQSYNAYLAAMGQNNAAVGQNNQANLAAQAMQNQSLAQNNAAALAQGQFRNASVGQNNAANMAAYQAQNQALGDQYGLNMTGRQNAFQEQLAVRNQPINEISALLAGGQVQVPSFQQPYQQGVGATDIGGMMQADNQARNDAYTNQMTGMFGLGRDLLGGLFKLSDKRAKQDITRIGETDEGLPIYKYQYKKGVGGNGMFQLGVLAQEVEKRRPDAVMTGSDGLKRVDYGKVA